MHDLPALHEDTARYVFYPRPQFSMLNQLDGVIPIWKYLASFAVFFNHLNRLFGSFNRGKIHATDLTKSFRFPGVDLMKLSDFELEKVPQPAVSVIC